MHRRTRKILWNSFGAIVTAAIVASTASAQTDEPPKTIDSIVAISDTNDEVKAFGARVTVDGANARVKAAGAFVDVRGDIDGHVWAAGADVTIAGQVGGPVRAAGADVTVRGSVAGDVGIAGAIVSVNSSIRGNVRAAGASVRVGPLSNIEGELWAAGASVTFDGQVSGESNFAGAVVTLNGRADGDVTVHAERLIVGPRAVIGGNLLVRSLSEPQIDSTATISGEIVRETPGEWYNELPEVSFVVVAGGFALSIFLSGLVLLIFARATFGEAVDHVRFRPLSSLLYGIVVFLCLVILAALLMSSLLGFAFGFALLLVLPLMFVLAQPVAAAGIIGWIFGRGVPALGVTRLLLFLILGSLVVGFVGIIPITGPWIVVAAFVFGFGGFIRSVLWRFRTTRDSDHRFGAKTVDVGTE